MLKGQAKTDYQREYQRKHQGEYRQRRKVLIRSNHSRSNQGLADKLKAMGLNIEGNQVISVKREAPPLSSVPLYNPAIHRPRDRVLIKPPYGKLRETVIPTIDADGNPMPQ